ncbi:MAG: CcoQ/FixQ family Cbb3-type cytochrome c oxidase assembly chaperone [Reyranellaceae bacterium]
MDYGIHLVILGIAFIGIVIWTFGRRRKARFDKDAAIPFDDRKK